MVYLFIIPVVYTVTEILKWVIPTFALFQKLILGRSIDGQTCDL